MNEENQAAAGIGRKRTIAVAAAVGAASMLAGGVLAATLSASADTTSVQGAAYGAPPAGSGAQGHPSRPMRSEEKLLTGTTKEKVTAVVTKKYPAATIQRVETDSDGVYEAHIVDNGQPVIVQVGKDFTITGTQTGMGGGRHGDGGGPAGAAGEGTSQG